MKRRSLMLILIILTCQIAVSQDIAVYRAPKVGTLRAYVGGDERSQPIISLDGDERVIVEFDYLSSDILDLEYSVVHCSSDGRPSDLQPSEYLQGFAVNRVTDYASSSGTTVEYVNYRISLPNDDVRMLLSGRYLVTVFQSGQPENIVAQTTFMVYEPLVTVNVEIVRPQTVAGERYAHDVRLSVECTDSQVSDVFNELSVSVLQNGCPYSSRTGLKPKQIVGDKLVYSYSGDLLMAGGNEFRRFDLRYLKQTPINYNAVDYVAPYFHISTPTDQNRAFSPYFSETDQNGQYVVYAQTVVNNDDHYRTADYVFVHPTLSTDAVLDGDVFVCGSFCNWRLDSTNMMTYNFDAHRYEGNLRLKQGVYDYVYVVRNYYDGKVDMERFEGSHSETGNSYLFLVFFRRPTADYEQLVGVLTVDN